MQTEMEPNRLHKCTACGRPMTDEELFLYQGRCKRCEQGWTNRMGRWSSGEAKAIDPKKD